LNRHQPHYTELKLLHNYGAFSLQLYSFTVGVISLVEGFKGLLSSDTTYGSWCMIELVVDCLAIYPSVSERDEAEVTEEAILQRSDRLYRKEYEAS
jgi:hypothetical protein